LLMPLVVLLVFYTLQSFRNEATRTPASQSPVQASADGTTEP